MEKEKSPDTLAALIVGVTGMAGFSLAEALKQPTTPGSPWKVYGVARRPLPSWFPSCLIDCFPSPDALDHEDAKNKLFPVAHEITHVFWISRKLRKSEEVNISMNSTMLANVLNALKPAARSRLRHVTLLNGTKHYMGPIFDPSLRGELVHQEPPFKEDLGRLPYPNFYYALEDLVASYLPSITHSVHRSSIIIGASSRSLHNTLLTLSVYATICRYQGLPFRYPGNKYTWEHFCDMSDARVLAEQQIWAAVTEGAKNQAFNCTNGDVFTWKSLRGVLCEGKGKVWDEIVEKYGLFETKMEDITCFEALNVVLHFGFRQVCSMNKSRESGFLGFADTLKSIPMWVGRLRDMKIIP
uniref:3-oxo-Delta(4,5)-steroid 5-beta-reductase-like n=1 Tax=Populus alba TaxID=43335 RepID=A0A4U5QVQ2_POPAL|nr:3-oxo-Delta(4,5)-steroid 5-beta-reductase-like [Populus alba]